MPGYIFSKGRAFSPTKTVRFIVRVFIYVDPGTETEVRDGNRYS